MVFFANADPTHKKGIKETISLLVVAGWQNRSERLFAWLSILILSYIILKECDQEE